MNTARRIPWIAIVWLALSGSAHAFGRQCLEDFQLKGIKFDACKVVARHARFPDGSSQLRLFIFLDGTNTDGLQHICGIPSEDEFEGVTGAVLIKNRLREKLNAYVSSGICLAPPPQETEAESATFCRFGSLDGIKYDSCELVQTHHSYRKSGYDGEIDASWDYYSLTGTNRDGAMNLCEADGESLNSVLIKPAFRKKLADAVKAGFCPEKSSSEFRREEIKERD